MLAKIIRFHAVQVPMRSKQRVNEILRLWSDRKFDRCNHLFVGGAEQVHQGRHRAVLDQHAGVLRGAGSNVGEGPQRFDLHGWALVELQPAQQERHPVAVQNLARIVAWKKTEDRRVHGTFREPRV